MSPRGWGRTLAVGLALSALVPPVARAAELREVIDQSRQMASSSPDSARRFLESSFTLRPDREAAQLRIEIGDLARQSNHFEAAAKQYREAARLDPTLETPPRRLIEMALRELPLAAQPLFEDLSLARAHHPSVALRGYRDLIRALADFRAAGASRTDSMLAASYANQALVEIVDLLASSTGRIDIDAVGVDSAAVPGPYAELSEALSITAHVPPAGFWMSSATNRNVLARAKLAQGRRAITMGRPDLADFHFEAGLHLAPSYDAYMYGALRESRMVRLDLCTELLGLLANQPAFGPGSPRFEKLIDEIFMTKGMAYQANDLEAIQKHHEVLGFLYASRGIWTSGQYARNAIFQLEHVLQAARRRVDEVGYQPLPWVKVTLARGYERSGPTREGSAMHVEATMAYFDVDQLDTARVELGAAARFWKATSAKPPAAWAALRRVLADRLAVERLSQPGASIDSSYDEIAKRWFDPEDLELPKDFLRRQRFKILTDLSAIEVPPARTRMVALGLAKKLDESSAPTLVGVADLLRLERLQAQALTAVDAEGAPPQLQVSSGTSSKSGVLLGSTAGRTATRVVPNQNLGLALYLKSLMASDSTLRRPGTRVVLRRDSVVVETQGSTAAEREKLQREVKRFSPRDLRVVSR